MIRHLTDHEVNWFFSLPDEQLAAIPLLSEHREPQIAPQEYECGCVAVTRITDRDYREGGLPFEMRLAVDCESESCERRRAQADEDEGDGGEVAIGSSG